MNRERGAPLRLLVVDDHMVVREGIRAMAERTDSLELVGETASPAETLGLLAEHETDIALVDYRLGNGSGLDLCAEIKRSYPNVHVVIFTAFGNPQLLTEAIRVAEESGLQLLALAAAAMLAEDLVSRGEAVAALERLAPLEEQVSSNVVASTPVQLWLSPS